LTISTNSRITAAGEGWRAMLDAVAEQTRRLGDPRWQSPADGMQPLAQNFRADPLRSDDVFLDELARGLSPADSVVDIGAGAGRFALPLARRVADVVALEPSPSMRNALEAEAARFSIRNVRVLDVTWPVANLRADLVFAAHVVYGVRDIEAFVVSMRDSARKFAAAIVFAEPPQARLFGFWQAVYGEQRAPNPHLPQLVEVLQSLDLEPEVQVFETDQWPLGPLDRARAVLRNRLRIVAASPADVRLEAALPTLLTDWDGRYGPLDRSPLRVAVVRWPGAADGVQRRTHVV
jgi:SAM-dependent methyltransferase